MGYQEKRVWVLLFTELVFYGAYFWALHHYHVHLMVTAHVVLGLIVLQIVLYSALALTSRPERRDERDTAIEIRAFRTAYFTLAIAVVVMIAFIIHLEMFRHGNAMLMVNTLIFILALAELSKLITQVTLYRRLA